MKKLKSRRAFTLVEMLSVILIILLLTAAAAVIFRLATESYSESLMRSESEILSSTLTSVITDELRYAGSTSVDSDGSIESLFSQKYGSLTEGFATENGKITLGGRMLLSDKAYTYGQEVTSLSVVYDSERKAFDISFSLTRDGSVLSEKSFSVKPINPVRITEN